MLFLEIVPGLHTEVQQAKTDNTHTFVKNTIRTRDRHKGDIIIIKRRGATGTVTGLVSEGMMEVEGQR